MVGHRISFSDNLQKTVIEWTFLWTLCVAMVTDMTSQVPSKYGPAIELQGDIVCPPHQISFFVIFHRFTNTATTKNPFEPP